MSLAHREALIGYAMILPWVIGFLVFALGPMLATLYLSFTEYNVLASPSFIGVRNYATALTGDPVFWKALFNTAYYVVISVPLGMVLAFIVATLLSAKRKGRSFLVYRALFYLPYVVPSVAASVIWVWLLDNQAGIINYFLGVLHIGPVPWLVDESWSKPALILVNVWWNLGAIMVIYLAALQSIPVDLYEAAEIDGASPWQRIRYVTLPLMTPALFFTLVLGVINSFQVFNSAFVMTNGGPLNSTLFIMLYIYQSAFQFFEFGYASALAWILFLIVFVLTAVLFRASRGRVYYEGER